MQSWEVVADGLSLPVYGEEPAPPAPPAPPSACKGSTEVGSSCPGMQRVLLRARLHTRAWTLAGLPDCPMRAGEEPAVEKTWRREGKTTLSCWAHTLSPSGLAGRLSHKRGSQQLMCFLVQRGEGPGQAEPPRLPQCQLLMCRGLPRSPTALLRGPSQHCGVSV